MLNTKFIQREVIANRKHRGWESATNLEKTTSGIAEELGEFAKALRTNDNKALIDALGDIAVFCFGAFEILEVDGAQVINSIVNHNKTRVHKGNH